jgi:large subunit ribosomal protein L15
MQQHELRSPKGATHKRKRVGRGNASGHGTYATKGMKGQKARSGGGVRPGFEGGQLPMVRRMAYKRGFTNPFRVDYEEVNVGSLAGFAAGTEVNATAMAGARVARTSKPIKVLGEGELSVALTVEAASFSKSAREKIEAAGGSVRWLNGEPSQEAPAAERKPNSVAARARKAGVAAKAAAEAKAAQDAADGVEKKGKKAKKTDNEAPAEGEGA